MEGRHTEEEEGGGEDEPGGEREGNAQEEGGRAAKRQRGRKVSSLDDEDAQQVPSASAPRQPQQTQQQQQQQEEEEERCAICYETLLGPAGGDAATAEENEEDELHVGDGDALAVAQIQACGHAFHWDCLRAWSEVRPQCPLCRVTVGMVALFYPNSLKSSSASSSSSSDSAPTLTSIVPPDEHQTVHVDVETRRRHDQAEIERQARRRQQAEGRAARRLRQSLGRGVGGRRGVQTVRRWRQGELAQERALEEADEEADEEEEAEEEADGDDSVGSTIERWHTRSSVTRPRRERRRDWDSREGADAPPIDVEAMLRRNRMQFGVSGSVPSGVATSTPSRRRAEQPAGEGPQHLQLPQQRHQQEQRQRQQQLLLMQRRRRQQQQQPPGRSVPTDQTEHTSSQPLPGLRPGRRIIRPPLKRKRPFAFSVTPAGSK